jgi:hypothetical protein
MAQLRPVCNFIRPPQETSYTLKLCTQSIRLPFWEYSLLEHGVELQPPAIIISQLQTRSLITCSDGSVVQGGGAFGFIIGTDQGQRLFQGSGMAPGAYSNSFRSEAYGVLATLRWYLHSYIHLQLDGTLPIEHYLDNQSVIRRINRALDQTVPFPNHRLLPEQDVIDEIVATMRQIPTPIKITWVKGHQDSASDYASLDVPAQFNCDADRLAASFTRSHVSHSTTVNPLPQTPVALHVSNKSITGHIKSRIREAASTPILHQYLCQKFEWDADVIQMIDWTTFTYILPKYHKTRTTLVKHL